MYPLRPVNIFSIAAVGSRLPYARTPTPRALVPLPPHGVAARHSADAERPTSSEVVRPRRAWLGGSPKRVLLSFSARARPPSSVPNLALNGMLHGPPSDSARLPPVKCLTFLSRNTTNCPSHRLPKEGEGFRACASLRRARASGSMLRQTRRTGAFSILHLYLFTYFQLQAGDHVGT